MIDITAPKHEVEVIVSDDGKRLWVNVDGACALRVCQIPAGTLRVSDNRRATPDQSRDLPQDF